MGALMADLALFVRYLRASASYHDAHGGPVRVSRRAAFRFLVPRTMRPYEARYWAFTLETLS